MSNSHTLTFTAAREHIDTNGHVNNAVWVRWMEEVAAAHWLADARAQDIATYSWIVTRHEIDYRGNIGEGDSVTAVTQVLGPARGVRFDRHIVFTDAAGRELVRARTTWALVERSTGRLTRVPPELAAPFLPRS